MGFHVGRAAEDNNRQALMVIDESVGLVQEDLNPKRHAESRQTTALVWEDALLCFMVGGDCLLILSLGWEVGAGPAFLLRGAPVLAGAECSGAPQRDSLLHGDGCYYL